MLIDFKFSNYSSFKNETILSMKANKLSSKSDSGTVTVAIYGINGAVKSNVIRACWLSVQFIKNEQRIQHETSPIPLTPL